MSVRAYDQARELAANLAAAQAMVLTAPECARMLGLSPSRFWRLWQDLVVAEQFPPPVSGRTRLLWSRAQVLAWIDRPRSIPLNAGRRGRAAQEGAPAIAHGATDLGAWEADLDRRLSEVKL